MMKFNLYVIETKTMALFKTHVFKKFLSVQRKIKKYNLQGEFTFFVSFYDENKKEFILQRWSSVSSLRDLICLTPLPCQN